MPKTLRYRLLKVGAMPSEMASRIAHENILSSDAGIRVIVKRHGKAPGFRGGSTGRFSGAFAITDQRIIAAISKSIVIDAPYDGASDSSRATLTVREDGLHARIDASIHPACSGEIDFHFKHEFAADELTGIPHRELAFNFSSDLVPKVFGVPA